MKALYPGETVPINFLSVFSPHPSTSNSTNSQTSIMQQERIDPDPSTNGQSPPSSRQTSPKEQTTESPPPELQTTHGTETLIEPPSSTNELDTNPKVVDTEATSTQDAGDTISSSTHESLTPANLEPTQTSTIEQILPLGLG
ncbi:rho GTPase-activating protein gacQ-like [Camellia sinensis]|uniref:rho GTPase-activating protein gacQ-like n=1 Tax=Camellia sinensis TaxID=4442 RepID=UPI001035876C|nr:rho GTPase-activating protein gacQ-like [Camellia sinensis]